jgi:hypothetical protein
LGEWQGFALSVSTAVFLRRAFSSGASGVALRNFTLIMLDFSRFFGLVGLEREVNGKAKTLLKLTRND